MQRPGDQQHAIGNRSATRVRFTRRGAASLDYVLILGSLLPLCGILLYMGRRIILLAYEMVSVAVSSPFF